MSKLKAIERKLLKEIQGSIYESCELCDKPGFKTNAKGQFVCYRHYTDRATIKGTVKIKRNSVCKCGSGKKAKRCCLLKRI